MGNCPKCGTQLGLLDSQRKLRGKDVSPEFYNKPLCFSCYKELTKVNRKCPQCGKGFGFVASNLQKWVSKDIHPEWKGQLLHPECVNEAIKEKKNEIKNGRFCINCVFYHQIYNKLESLMLGLSVEPFQPHYCKKLKMNMKNPYGNDAEKCTSYITDEEYKEKALSGEMDKEKANVQIILDFSSLKDVMSKGGLVMSTYKCPNCNGMVNIPVAGKVLVCQYCGTPIKPVDIFEKIKSLIQ